jgi:subtilisin family serine protease
MRRAFFYLIAVWFAAWAAAPVGAAVHELRNTISAGQSSLPAYEPARLYIVQFDDPPALLAEQSKLRKSGEAASVTAVDAHGADVQRYINDLRDKQNEILLSLNLSQNRVYSYGYTFNGVAVRLTPTQAKLLSQRRGVRRVWEDTKRPVATNDSPQFLGLLDNPGGLRSDLGLTGEDVVVGVIDSGIAPNHPSFKDHAEKKRPPRICRSEWAENSLLGLWLCRRFKKPARLMYNPPSDWRGVCEAGPGFSAQDCNNKLIGARFFNEGFNAGGETDENEFNSPADADGHGTHIASIAAGNTVNAEIYGKSLGQISGMAPRARVAVYKACWLEPGAARASCSVADLAMAIEQAVADGVDIINYSIGDRNDSLDDPDDLALLAATEAGVLSVAATGNDGPSLLTIQSPATTPWVISVGATSRPGKRLSQALRVNAPESLKGDYESREAGFTPRLAATGPVTGQLVLVNDASTVTEDDDIGSIYDGCTEAANASELRGNIALIQRGDCNFDVKISLAEQAGAIAVVVFNNEAELLVMDGNPALVDIPAVLLGQADGQLLRDKLLEGARVSMTLDSTLFTNIEYEGNLMGAYSGRGPSFADSDFLKPDLVAPGTAILGGHTPDVANGFRGELFQYLTGTSQAAPHVAGTAALIKQAHPEWTPAEIKSALMTSSRQDILKEDGIAQATPFDMGAGHIVPNSAVEPGLIYPVDIAEYDAYLCRYGLERITRDECVALARAGLERDARDINLPSVAITELAGSVEIKRRVRNTGPAAQFTVTTAVPEGISLEVEPATLSLSAGETGEFTLRFGAPAAELYRWHYGSFRWTSDSHSVFSPFVVQPALFSAPMALLGDGPSGNLRLPIGFGYSGDYAARLNGLVPPCILPDSDKTDALCTNEAPAQIQNGNGRQYVFTSDEDLPGSVRRFKINVPPEDNELLRIALFDTLTTGTDDLDIFVYYCAPVIEGPAGAGLPCEVWDADQPYASETPGTSDELIDITAPAAGTWIIDVYAYDTERPTGTDFRLYAWSFGSNIAAGNLLLTDAPAGATAGTTVEAQLTWNALPEGLWLGGVTHYDNPADPDDLPLGLTIVEIDNSLLHDW